MKEDGQLATANGFLYFKELFYTGLKRTYQHNVSDWGGPHAVGRTADSLRDLSTRRRRATSASFATALHFRCHSLYLRQVALGYDQSWD